MYCSRCYECFDIDDEHFFSSFRFYYFTSSKSGAKSPHHLWCVNARTLENYVSHSWWIDHQKSDIESFVVVVILLFSHDLCFLGRVRAYARHWKRYTCLTELSINFNSWEIQKGKGLISYFVMFCYERYPNK